MKKFSTVLFLALTLVGANVFAQTLEKCGTMHNHAELQKKQPKSFI